MALGYGARVSAGAALELLLLQHLLEIGERRVGGGVALFGVCAAVGCLQQALVLVVVAVEAEQFPIAAIRRIVVVVVVPMVHRQFAQIAVGEFARAAAADPGVDLQRLFAVALFALRCGAAGLGDDAVELSRVWGGSGHFVSPGDAYGAPALHFGLSQALALAPIRD